MKRNDQRTVKGKAIEAAGRLLGEAIVVDGLGGSLADPAPPPVDGVPYEEYVLRSGFTALNVTLVSHPTYAPSFQRLLAAVDENLSLLRKREDVLLPGRTAEDVRRAKREGKLGVIFGLQSPSALGEDRTRVTILHQLGVRVMQLTYMERSLLGDGCLETREEGLTPLGRAVVREMNSAGCAWSTRMTPKRRRRSRPPSGRSSSRTRTPAG